METANYKIGVHIVGPDQPNGKELIMELLRLAFETSDYAAMNKVAAAIREHDISGYIAYYLNCPICRKADCIHDHTQRTTA